MSHSLLIKNTAAFAKKCHKHQTRKTGEPYFTHPEAVAKSVMQWTKDPHVIVAAYLHDVIEDCGRDYEDLLERFGVRVARYVAGASRDFRKPKEESMHLFRRDLVAASPEIKLIVAADIAHNASTPADSAFMKLWFRKTRATLPYLIRGNLGTYRKAILSLTQHIESLVR